MNNTWQKIKEVLSKILQKLKEGIKLFFKLFNTKLKLAAISLTVYIWFVLQCDFWNKISCFLLFAILMLILDMIKQDK